MWIRYVTSPLVQAATLDSNLRQKFVGSNNSLFATALLILPDHTSSFLPAVSSLKSVTKSDYLLLSGVAGNRYTDPRPMQYPKPKLHRASCFLFFSMAGAVDPCSSLHCYITDRLSIPARRNNADCCLSAPPHQMSSKYLKMFRYTRVMYISWGAQGSYLGSVRGHHESLLERHLGPLLTCVREVTRALSARRLDAIARVGGRANWQRRHLVAPSYPHTKFRQ